MPRRFRRNGTGASRSAARSASPAAATRSSSSTARSSNRGPAATTSSATGCPTARERQGDFSQTTDNLGNVYNFIKDPRISGACSATDQTACFADGGVRGKIPANMLYQTGLNILSMFPLPTIDNVPVGQAYNFETTRPDRVHPRLAAGRPRRLPGLLVAPCVIQVLGLGPAQSGHQRRRCLASTTRRCSGRS